MRPIGGWGDVVIDLSGVAVPQPGGAIPILLNHDHREIIGHATVTIDRSITAHGVVSGTGTAAQEFLGSARNGFPWKSSIGLSVAKTVFLKESETATINGAAISGPVTVVETESARRNFRFTMAGGHDIASRRIAARKSNITEVSDMDNELSVETIRQQAADESRRIAAIREICAGRYGELEVEAIEAGLTAAECELRVLRAERQAGPKFEATTSSGTCSDLDA